MLRLRSSTSPEWVELALRNMDEILIDHAHCEKKAASMAINLLFRYPEYLQLMRPLSELAREELRHFEQVLTILDGRGIQFRRQKPSTYAGRLVQNARNNEPERMLDIMLCACLIEARSCERMTILASELRSNEPELARFYRGLLACEARHHQIYVDLLDTIYPKNDVRERLEELSELEARVIAVPDAFPRFHS